MDVSTFKDFKKCEAATLAQIEGTWQPIQDQKSLIIGNYVHSHFESKKAHESFVKAHAKDIYKYGRPEKGVKADYKLADQMIKTLEDDQAFQRIYMPGKKEVIVTGTIAGKPWKGKIDSLVLHPDVGKPYFCDLKTVAEIRKGFWDEETHSRVPFIKAYGYYYQMSMYRELIRQTFGVTVQPFIWAVSKEKVPDHEAFSFNSGQDEEWLNEAMQGILENQDEYWSILKGKQEPQRCEQCEYCRSTKQITHFINAAELEVD